ncbi:MAG: hypothetical protein IJJ28_07900, partial [Lentisphaeria bacterium]|nr:hypothetical protein [Lentisphaeria bacterium]
LSLDFQPSKHSGPTNGGPFFPKYFVERVYILPESRAICKPPPAKFTSTFNKFHYVKNTPVKYLVFKRHFNASH